MFVLTVTESQSSPIFLSFFNWCLILNAQMLHGDRSNVHSTTQSYFDENCIISKTRSGSSCIVFIYLIVTKEKVYGIS